VAVLSVVAVSLTGAGAGGAVSVATAPAGVLSGAAAAAVAAGALSVVGAETLSSLPDLLLHALVAAPTIMTTTNEPRLILMVSELAG
jgi:hypothetical protein